jgi:hypothetical protein
MIEDGPILQVRVKGQIGDVQGLQEQKESVQGLQGRIGDVQGPQTGRKEDVQGPQTGQKEDVRGPQTGQKEDIQSLHKVCPRDNLLHRWKSTRC